MNFHIDYEKQPKSFLKKQDKFVAKRIVNKVDMLSSDPIPHDTKRIVGCELPTFRIRIGKHRALYRVNYETNRIVIIKIDKRDKVYD